MKDLRAFLGETNPFRELPPAELDRLTRMARLTDHDKGETVLSEGREASSVWVLYSGRLEIFKYTSDGKARAIEVIQPGELFGTLCRLGGTGRTYPCTAVASIASTSIEIPEGVFLDLFGRYPSVVSGVCGLCSQRLNAMQELTCSSQEPAEKRIVRTLLQLSNTHGPILPYTRREIGELSGTTVETTIRTLSAMEKKGWIDSERGEIRLADTAHLKSIIE